VRDEEVEVAAGPVPLAGHLTVPEQALGAVVFAHGSGSSRHSPRNRYVAAVLNDARLATLLFDLLTPDEELDRANVFDIELLAGRLVDVTAWLRKEPELSGLPVGYFGASTGAAAALVAAAEPGAEVAAVVSRGGRPDLAEGWLGEVYAPTLFIVGGHDDVVLALNREAQAHLAAPDNRLAVVPGATHLFEEPGALPAVADLARRWFVGHFAPHRTDRCLGRSALLRAVCRDGQLWHAPKRFGGCSEEVGRDAQDRGEGRGRGAGRRGRAGAGGTGHARPGAAAPERGSRHPQGPLPRGSLAGF
jgi:pimeloyl-ACP methyl ester carboxylesterase